MPSFQIFTLNNSALKKNHDMICETHYYQKPFSEDKV